MPETLTVAQIRDEPNVEVRRIMLERFGAERFMAESDGRCVAEERLPIRTTDGQVSSSVVKLWAIPEAPDEPDGKPFMMVEMINSTPEPDGSFRTYYERVPPTTRTPVAGLAWQANMGVSEYEAMGTQT
jgi:hypothetical protein